MKRFLSGLVPLVLSACMVDTAVVGDPAVNLGEDLATRCEKLCMTYDACEPEGTSEDCNSDCVAYFNETYVGKGEVCEKAGARVLDCMETATCADLRVENACNLDTEQARCANSIGRVSCNAGWTSEQPNGSALDCDVGYEDCSDGKVYELICSQPGNPPDCHCMVDGETTGSFSPIRLECPLEEEARQICGWPIAESGSEPAPVVCQVIGTGFGSPVSCEVTAADCSGGRSYGIECDGSGGPESCRCEMDGVAVGFSGSPEGICPFVADADGGIVALNYLCGFKLVPQRLTF